MKSMRPLPIFATVTALVLLGVPALVGQLPPEAVDLEKVKIPEAIESEDLCPVHLEPSAEDGPTWSWDGVSYRGSTPDAKEEFMKDPEGYAAAAEKERYVLNFMKAMSTIWCPVTDEVTPGGRKQVEGLGYTWESCCSFCDEEMTEDSFADALERLRERAELSYELIGAHYTEGASSPVEGAIKEVF